MRITRILTIAAGMCSGWAMLAALPVRAADDPLAQPAQPPATTPPAPSPRDVSRIDGEVVVTGGSLVVDDGGRFGAAATSPTNITGTIVFDAGSDLILDGPLNLTGVGPATQTRAAYLGITTSSPDATLQRQLQLKPGVGLVVDSVEPDGPAGNAGIKQYDVLHKLDGQLMVNTEQLAVLVRSYEPGKEVKLTLIREGKEQTLTAKLGERAVPPLTFTYRPGVRGLTLNNATPFETYAAYAAAQEHAATALRSTFVPGDRKPAANAISMAIESLDRKLTLTTPGGHKRLKVQDTAGKVILETSVDTKEEVDKLPPDVRSLYDSMMKGYDSVMPQTAPSDVHEAIPAPTPAK